MMDITVAIQMDPIERIDVRSDSTYVLALEAQKRGYNLLYYLPKDLTLYNKKLTASVRALSLNKDQKSYFKLGSSENIDLATIDVILMRQDPPFDMSYITATHFLEQLHPETLVVNDPSSVRNCPEKIFVTHFAEFMPPTIITSSVEEVWAFRDRHKDLVVKPLFGNGGAGVFHITPEDENLSALLELYLDLYKEPIIVQRFEPRVKDGDKRIILIDGQPAGAVKRIPQSGEIRSNLHVGGRAEKSSLSRRDKEICEAIGPALRDRGLLFVGIDVIGEFVTEINVTSPTCLQEINKLDGKQLEADIWNCIEAKL